MKKEIVINPIRNNRGGFTLVELLVVISIIALLLSIMMPALSRVKEQANSLVCRSNLKQLSVGFIMYLQSNKNKGPESPDSYYNPGYVPWSEQILPYMGDSQYTQNPEMRMQKIMFCPSTLKPLFASGYSPGLPKNRWRYDMQTSAMKGRQIEGSYAMNVWVGGGKFTDYVSPSWPQFALSFRQNVPGSVDVPVFSDCTWSESYPLDTDKPPRKNISSSNAYADFWTPSILRYYLNRHARKINSSFTDGHVASVPLTGLWNLQWHKGFKKKEYVPIPTR